MKNDLKSIYIFCLINNQFLFILCSENVNSKMINLIFAVFSMLSCFFSLKSKAIQIEIVQISISTIDFSSFIFCQMNEKSKLNVFYSCNTYKTSMKFTKTKIVFWKNMHFEKCFILFYLIHYHHTIIFFFIFIFFVSFRFILFFLFFFSLFRFSFFVNFFSFRFFFALNVICKSFHKYRCDRRVCCEKFSKYIDNDEKCENEKQ